jgi:PAS domain S-box-containing protein
MTARRDAAPGRPEARPGDLGGWAGARRVSLAERLDESAAEVHLVTAIKAVLSLAGCLIALLVVDARAATMWLAASSSVLTWSWAASRRQARGEAVGWRLRAAFVAGLAAENLCWAMLGALLWSAGSVSGQACALVIWAALCGIGVLLFYNTPAIFLVAGVLPASAAFTLVALRSGMGWREALPVWIALGLSVIFDMGRALETPSHQASKRRLNDSLNRYRILAENVTDVIMRTELDGRQQYVSPAALSVLGYPPEELVGTLRQDFLKPEDAAGMDDILARMLAAPDRPQVVTLQVHRKDGRPIWLQTSAKLVYEQGEPVAVVSVSRDVTEQVATDAALKEAKAAAEAANLAKAEFLANVSHEIRTPMNGVLGALHLLERESLSDEGRELIRQAGDCGRMLSQLLNDVLDFAKIDAGKLDLAPEPMNAGEALNAVAALLLGQARAKGVELRCEITGEDLWIEADPARLRQVIFNILGNAVKFTLQGSVVARLAIRPAGAGRRRVTLTVEDTGIGIAEDAQRRLFERFRQAESDTARRFGGTGLGLAISQVIARAMGGDIRCRSIEGVGSTFELEFEAPAAEPVVAEPTEEGVLEGVRVLLVEDNATNRLVARTMLTRLGAHVDEAEDGVEGLRAARDGAHDLILMDVQMPHMDGIDATRAIRGLAGAAADVPIIGLTANVMAHQRAQYLAAGMDGIVAKPISPAALLAEIGRLLSAETRLAG